MTEERLPAVYFDAAFVGSPANEIRLTLLEPSPATVGWPLDKILYIEAADISNVPTRALALTTKVWINGQLAFDRTGGPANFLPPFDGPGSFFATRSTPGSAVDDAHLMVIDNTGLWQSEEVVQVRVFAESAGGYTLDQTYTFTIRDVTAPEVDAVEAIGPSTVRVTFNEPMLMDASAGGAMSPSNYTFRGITTPYWLPDPPNPSSIDQVTNFQVDCHFDQELSHGQTYGLIISNVEDTSGNAVAANDNQFVAADLLAPDDREADLWLRIPQKLRRWDNSLTGGSPGHTERLIQCLQDVFDLMYYDIDLLRYLYDIDRAPMDSINLLLEQFGNPFALSLTDNQKRKLLRNLIAMYRQKGTTQGIINAIFFFMGIPVTITIPWGERTWRIGYDKLGITTYLGPSDEYGKYTFFVNVPVALTDDQRDQMDQIIRLMKVAHEHHIIKEPVPPPPLVWRLGYDKLGIGTRLGG